MCSMYCEVSGNFVSRILVNVAFASTGRRDDVSIVALSKTGSIGSISDR
jgi:hypothetical protein